MKTVYVAVLFALVSIATINPALAEIILLNDPSLPSSSDGFNITRDTSTGLEWLDLDLSVGRSYADLIGTDGSNEFEIGGDFEGFRYANKEQLIGANNGPQLDSLYKSLGVPPGVFTSIGSYESVRTLITTVGCFGSCSKHGYSSGTVLEIDNVTVGVSSVQAFMFNNNNWGQSNPSTAPDLRTPNDSFPLVQGNWLIRDVPPSDVDNDGVADALDNCTLVANANQIDTNGDGFGNACDPDLDNNGIVNFLDLSMWIPFFNQANSGDEDFNGDGVANFIDFALFPQYSLMPPGPSGIAP